MTKINTKKSGVVRTIIFPIRGGYRAVCLDFDIIEEASTRLEVEEQIKEVIVGYVANICKNKLNDALLNRHADKRYWDMYDSYQKLITAKREAVNTSSATNKVSLFTTPVADLFKQSAYCSA
ncbi:hypothetical protein A2524_00635 [Candidatus Wolfebacteria bacterium RIFOXYD12_FULL_48_21]|uniref:Uncharacterized protein n=1 Tax=Candidatus Wolfebacteria bacterium RIFOXYD1_FULL_48_65 TaxID=1802561 RepID=A0A1F8DZB1_9BACT|nr:MAG: hypothetical protein A2610_00300 [Candidatus Wolfebacteria bacterium RIFOXYD1_FULL_48_65]OGM94322.1 MAG: hypothetical protein A2524_00635 [Candidatus Wolfebacteria bacterium RIFOXYD12_FULL_48_21]OGM96987.1 MAG: hypothetical protein A2532_01595 [Candidatus Wolfebacteria bacterium RIFOXYD2_FULL_48_11]